MLDGIDLAAIGIFATQVKEPVIKLLDVVEKGIGKIYEPTHIKRMAKAKAEEIRLISAASEENMNLPILYLNGNVEIDTKSGEELALRAQNRLFHKEVQRQNNIETTIRHAYNDLQAEEVVSAEPVDQDWATRFFNIVGEVNNEDMQVLWGKILSGEVKQPGSYSLRTLETLRNLSKKEAEAFTKITNYVLQSNATFLIYRDQDFLDSVGIKYADILLLDESGLLKGDTTLQYTMSFTEQRNTFGLIYQNKIVLLHDKNTEDRKINVPCYVLTKAGSEIYSISSKNNDESYINNTATKLKEQNLTVEYSQIIRVNPDGTINYSEAIKTL